MQPLRQPCVKHPVVAPAQGVDERSGVRTTVKHLSTLGIYEKSMEAGERMSFFSGCQDARNMISIVEIKCPKCGADIEVFVRDGKTVGDSVCDQCGYTIKENQNI